MQRLVRTYLSVCFHLPSMCLCVLPLFVRARLYMQLTTCDCLLDIGFAVVLISTSVSHYLDIGCAHSWHRLRIDSNNPWHPTYLNSAELPNSLWHRLRIILTSALHSAWHRLRIVLDRLYKFKTGYLDIGFAFVLTSASHYLKPCVKWYWD